MRFFSKSKANKAVAITYQIGWWAHQHILQIDSFQVEILKSDLNLMNSTSLIRYTVKGVLKADSMYLPYIQKVHHCEEIINTHSAFEIEKDSNTIDARIRISPIVGIKNKKRIGEEEVIPFEFSNEYRIKSLKWGKNRIALICGDFSEIIHLQQNK